MSALVSSLESHISSEENEANILRIERQLNNYSEDSLYVHGRFVLLCFVLFLFLFLFFVFVLCFCSLFLFFVFVFVFVFVFIREDLISPLLGRF